MVAPKLIVAATILVPMTSGFAQSGFKDTCPNNAPLPFAAIEVKHPIDSTCGVQGSTSASQNSQLVAVGLQGTILRSQVIPDLSPIKFVNYTQVATQNVFVVAGHADQQFTLDSSSDLTNWVTGPTLDLIYGSGTLLFITPAPTNEPPAQFFRTTVVP